MSGSGGGVTYPLLLCLSAAGRSFFVMSLPMCVPVCACVCVCARWMPK